MKELKNIQQKTKRLHKVKSEKFFTGVCAGVAKWSKIEPTIIRFAFIILTLFYGLGILLYMIAYFIMPDGPRGFTIKNIN